MSTSEDDGDKICDELLTSQQYYVHKSGMVAISNPISISNPSFLFLCSHLATGVDDKGNNLRLLKLKNCRNGELQNWRIGQQE